MQPFDSSLNEFGFLTVLVDLSPLSVDFERLVMNVSRNLFKGSILKRTSFCPARRYSDSALI